MTGMSHAPTGGTTNALDATLRWGGIVLHVGIAIFPLAASGLMAPLWALAVVAAAWAAGLAVAWRIGRTRPRLTPVVPVVVLVAWYAFMTVGDTWLGWVA